jgi:hypothetical protein
MVIKITIPGPVTYSQYTRLIKACLEKYNQETVNYLAARIKYYRESEYSVNDNFKIHILRDGYQLVSFKVKSSRKCIKRYNIDELYIQGDQRSNRIWAFFFRALHRICQIVSNICTYSGYGASFVPILDAGGRISQYVANNLEKKRFSSYPLRLKYN